MFVTCFLSLFRLLKSITEIGKSRKVGSGYIVWQEVFDNEVKVSKSVSQPVMQSVKQSVSKAVSQSVSLCVVQEFKILVFLSHL